MDNPRVIEYLDTANITRNEISDIQTLTADRDEFPSRAKRRVRENTIIYSTVRPNLEHFGFLSKPSENLIVSTGFLTLDVTDEQIDPKYFYYCLTRKDLTEYLHNVAVNNVSSYPSLNPDDIGDLLLEVPKCRGDQERVAAVLSALDAKIELNNRINHELEALAKTIYDYWFVQFDFPDANGRPYRISGGKMTYNPQLKREIPAGWEVSKVGKLLETSLGGTPSTEHDEYWENGEINWLNSGEVANFPIVDSEAKITRKAIQKSATELLPKGTCLISITRHLRPNILAIDACVNQSVVGIKENERFKRSFIYPYLKNEIPRFMTLRTGAQQPHINKDTIDDSLITTPPRTSNILESFYSQSEPMYSQIINLAIQNHHLAALRDWLLPMLMNGQVTVKEDI